MNTSPQQSRSVAAALTLFLVLWSALGGFKAFAVDPDQDNKTLIFPALVPKSGHDSTPPDGSASGAIRNAYESVFEPYWREVSYFDSDETTGAKIQGFNVDTKTYGYTYAPWPLNDRIGRPMPFDGYNGTLFFLTPIIPEGEGALLLGNADYMTGNLADDAWTPGEAFEDVNGDTEWTPEEPGEVADDYWNVDNNSAFRSNVCGDLLPRLDGANGGDWSPSRGEFYADYDEGTVVDGAGNVVSVDFDPSVEIYVANVSAQTNQVVTLSELDITPASCPDSNEGDFFHTAVENGEPPAIADIPLNDEFDFTVDINSNPRVVAATLVNGNNAVVTYESFRYQDDGSPYAGGTPPPTGEGERVVELVVVEVQIYQTSELFNTELASPTGLGIYGDPDSDPNEGEPNRDQDGTWTPEDEGTPAEPFEDFISWWDPAAGEFTYVPDRTIPEFDDWGDPDDGLEGHPLRNPSNNTGVALTEQEYEDYIRWNYPGDAAGLIALSGNGVWDGPEPYSQTGTSQLQQTGTLGTTITPDPDLQGQWDTRAFNSWTDWWVQVFGNTAPAWSAAIPVLAVYEPQVLPPATETEERWIPWSGTWGYNGQREFADLPSSMYYIPDGDPANTLILDAIYGVPGGDGNLGESTSAFSDSINGQDFGPGFPLGNSGPDGIIPSGGPFVYNVHGLSGYDAGNMLNFEMLTRWYEPPADLSGLDQASMLAANTHPWQFKDVNLDGMVDHGALNTVEPNYATGRQGTETDGNMLLALPPYNNARFVQAMIAAWDQAEDFDSFRQPNPPHDQVGMYFYPIYPPAPGPGAASLAGTSGQSVRVYTRDRDLPIFGFLQVRPMSGATIGGSDDGAVPPGSFMMGLLAHEQGHDLLGWPDLYDYDRWTGGGEQLNWPIGSYDLMSSGAMVHGIPDMKGAAGWITPRDLQSILVRGDEPVTLELYPVTRRTDQYYYFQNPNKFGEYFYVWYADDNSDFGVTGGPGVYISHTDRSAFGNAVPNQQRQNNHFIYEVLQADGLNELQDGVNLGDTGDPFPGSTGKRIFTADTNPSSRWWDQSDSGLRIFDVQVPADPQEPALVTIQWVDPAAGTRPPRRGDDSDGDGIVDAWEIFYFGNLTTADGTSDYRNDGITDLEAFLMDIDPTRDNTPYYGYDEDGDGLTSLEEVRNIGTDPKLPDTDDDGVSDGDLADTNRTDSTFPSVDRVLDVTGSAGAYVSTPPKDRFRTPEFSLMAWINPRAHGGSLFSREQTFTPSTYDYQLNLLPDGRIEFLFSALDGTGDVDLTTVQPLPLNQWTHVAAVFDESDGQMEIFLNGSQVASKFTLKRPPALSGSRVDVSRVAPGIDGMIDETAIFDAPLTVEDVRRFMVGIGDQTHDGMVSYYRFDDGTSAIWDPVDSRWEGTSDRPDWYRGQVQEFTAGYEEDWKEYWENSGTLVGEDIAMVPTPTDSPVALSELDTNGDGIPDQWYIEHGFDPAGPSVAYQDQDGDGVWNRVEYELGTDPHSRDSDQDGVNDGDEDDDGDGLTNLYEQSVSGTSIDSHDTDDDGLTDWEEITGKRLTSFYHVQYQNWLDTVIPEAPSVRDHIDNNVGVVTASNPLSSRSPERNGFLRTDASGHVQIEDQDRHALRSWTLEAWVRPDSSNATGGSIVRRTVSNPFRSGTGVNYEMGLEPNGSGGLRLYALHENIPAGGSSTVTKINRGAGEIVNDGLANRVPRAGETPLPATGDYPPGWTHVAASFDAENHRMTLYINGVELSRKTDAFEPEGLGLGEAVPHPGDLRIADGFNGSVDNAMILAGASSEEEILASATGQNSFEDTVEQYPSPLEGSRAGGAFSALSPAQAVSHEHVDGEILVRFKPEVAPADIENRIASDLGLAQRRRFSLVPLHVMTIEDGSTVEEKLEELADNPDILYAEPNYKVFKHATPNDPLFGDQWALANTGQDGGTAGADIDASNAWNGLNFGSRRVRVAVIDSGVDYNHPDLWANMWPGLGYDFVDDDSDPMDGETHGTHVAGTIGAVGNNGVGIAGVNWRAEIMALRFIGPAGGANDDAIASIEFAVDHGARISNNSWGGPFYSQAVFDAIAAAGRRGHLFIAAAGNDGADVDQETFGPSEFNLPNMITVAATDRNDELADFSNFGEHVIHLAAPGVDILSTLAGGGYGELSGTSMASPHVAGVAALIMARNPHLDVRSIRSLVLRSVDKLGSLDGMVLTGGRLNAAKALGGRGALVGFYAFNDFGSNVEDFSYAMDWENDWAHAGTLSGNATMIPFGGFLQVPMADCVAPSQAKPLDPLGAGWTGSGWRCDNQRAFSGTFSSTAGGLTDNNTTPILGNNQTASLETRVIGPGVVAFAWSWGTEETISGQHDNADNFRFLVNNTLKHTRNGWTGDTWGDPDGSNPMPIGTDVNLLGWETLSVAVPAGESKLKWEYRKDDYLAQYPDAVWLDNVSFEHTGPDSDGDGIPDAYETAVYMTNPMLMDTDGDGILDGKEIELGTNPLVGEQLVADGPPVGCVSGLSWTGIAGVKYMVQKSTDMNVWEEAFTGVLPQQKSRQTAVSNGQAMSYCDPDPNPPSPVFYRVIILP